MSADNWGTCPQCRLNATKAHAAKQKELADQYGKLPANEYMRLAAEVEKPLQYNDQSLREDYEIGTDKEGHFYVSYGCGCDCGFSFTFKHEAKAWEAKP